jgi:hypothetical protein
MRRLAIIFAILAAINMVEHIALSRSLTSGLNKVSEAPRRIRRALISLAGWRAVLMRPLRLFQLGPSN